MDGLWLCEFATRILSTRSSCLSMLLTLQLLLFFFIIINSRFRVGSQGPPASRPAHMLILFGENYLCLWRFICLLCHILLCRSAVDTSPRLHGGEASFFGRKFTSTYLRIQLQHHHGKPSSPRHSTRPLPLTLFIPFPRSSKTH